MEKTMTSNEKALSLSSGALSAQELGAQISLIQQHMKDNMISGEHYGVIPGCGDKPALLKSGAEKLGFIFKLCPTFIVRAVDRLDGHREYEIRCQLIHYPTGTLIAEGVGACSTMESKYRYRTQETDRPVPQAYWDTKDKSLLGGRDFGMKKVDGTWWISERVEHDNPADFYNTCLKMGKKRAHTDAILSATSASDIFAQDLDEDEGAKEQASGSVKKPAPQTAYNTARPSAQAQEGQFDYEIPYKEQEAKEIAKKNGCRWQQELKVWRGKEIPEIMQFCINQKVVLDSSTSQQPPL